MPRPVRLTDAELRAAVETLPGWTLRDGKLHRTFRFADFSAAFGFMTRAALAAEAMNHHPDWRNVWSVVEVDLTTHDAGGVTALDVGLARTLDALAGARA